MDEAIATDPPALRPTQGSSRVEGHRDLFYAGQIPFVSHGSESSPAVALFEAHMQAEIKADLESTMAAVVEKSHVYIREKLLLLGLLLGRRQLVIREAKLLAPHHPSPGLRSQGHCPENGRAFPESP